MPEGSSARESVEAPPKRTSDPEPAPSLRSPSQSGGVEPDVVDVNGAEAEHHYGREFDSATEIRQLQRLERTYGPQVHEWLDEGMPVEAMGTPSKMAAFRKRQGTPVPWDVERRNEQSLRRSQQAAAETGPTGDADVPDSVREVISSPGDALDADLQRAVEDTLGDSLGEVRVHTGPKAATAAEAIDAKAFTVGNHIAFNRGEYDPDSPEGQFTIAHELAHVRQQTGGALSMLPQEDAEFEIDPDRELEREADETARRVVQGDELGIQRLAATEVHVQRVKKTRREFLTGDFTTEEAAEATEKAQFVSSDQVRDAYKAAEFLAMFGATKGGTELLTTIYSVTPAEAIAAGLAVGATINVAKDTLHRHDIYVIYETAKLLGAEDRAVSFFESIGAEIPPAAEIEDKAKVPDEQSTGEDADKANEKKKDESESEGDTGLVEEDPLWAAYKFAEHLTTNGIATGITKAIINLFKLAPPKAVAVTLAVGGTVNIAKDRLHRNDIYVSYEVGKMLGVEDKVLAFFENIGVDIPPPEVLEGKAEVPGTGGSKPGKPEKEGTEQNTEKEDKEKIPEKE